MATLPADSFTVYSLCLKKTTTPANREIHIVKVSTVKTFVLFISSTCML